MTKAQNNSYSVVQFDSLSELQAQDGVSTPIVYIQGRGSIGDGGEGHFRWDSSDLSTEVGNDEVTAGEGDGNYFIAPASDKTGASGAWVRQIGYGQDNQVDSVSALQSGSYPASLDRIWLSGYYGVGTAGGGPLYRDSADTTTADNGGTVFVDADGVRWKRPEAITIDGFSYGAKADGATDDSLSLDAAFKNKSVVLGDGQHHVESSITVLDTLHQLVGAGWRRESDNTYTGSVIDGDSVVTDLLTMQPDPNDGTGTTVVSGLRLQDFALIHAGGGHALKIDNIVWAVLDRVCVEGGVIGVELDNWAFFAEIRNCRITRFSDTGLFIKGSGSQHAITNCQISSGTGDPRYAVRTQCEGSVIQGGQINANRTDDTAIGVWFDNPNSAQSYGKGGARGVLVETDIGFKIGTAGNSRWNNIVLEDIRADLGLVPGPLVQFTNGNNGHLFFPRVDRQSGGGVLAKWDGSEAVNCGVTLGASLFNVPFDVNANAVDPWVHFVGTMTEAARDSIHSDDNLRVIVDDVSSNSGLYRLGVSERIRGIWDTGFLSLSDDTSVSTSLPSDAGVLSITSVTANNNVNRNAIIWYDTGSLIAGATVGLDVTVDQSNGTLSGTTGTDGKITLRYDSTNELLYIENRTGGFLGLVYRATHHGPK